MKASYTTKNIIDKIIKRPGAYTGKHTLESIEIYLWGYQMAIDMNKLQDNKPDFNKFHKFVANKLGYSSSNAGWRRMIVATSLESDKFKEDEMTYEEHDKSIKLFYKLTKEFFGSVRNSVSIR